MSFYGKVQNLKKTKWEKISVGLQRLPQMHPILGYDLWDFLMLKLLKSDGAKIAYV